MQQLRQSFCIPGKKFPLSSRETESERFNGSLGTPLATSYGASRPVQSLENFGTTQESDGNNDR